MEIKTYVKLIPIALAVFVLTACGDSIEKDANRVAEITCEVKKLGKQGLNSLGNKEEMKQVKEDSKALSKKAGELKSEMLEKYADEENRKKFHAALEKALKNCD